MLSISLYPKARTRLDEDVKVEEILPGGSLLHRVDHFIHLKGHQGMVLVVIGMVYFAITFLASSCLILWQRAFIYVRKTPIPNRRWTRGGAYHLGDSGKA